MTIKAIETQYEGCRFRSRLEARWAVFFDTLGVQWEYEPQGFETPDGPYLPDFYLPVGKVWVEIKGASPVQNDLDRCRHIPGLVLLIGGVPRTIEDWVWQVDHGDFNWWYPYPTGWPFGGVRPPGDVVDGALIAARSARFEHGEAGRVRHWAQMVQIDNVRAVQTDTFEEVTGRGQRLVVRVNTSNDATLRIDGSSTKIDLVTFLHTFNRPGLSLIDPLGVWKPRACVSLNPRHLITCGLQRNNTMCLSIHDFSNEMEFGQIDIAVAKWDKLLTWMTAQLRTWGVSKQMSWISGGCVPEPTEPHVPVIKRELHGRTGYSVHVTYDVMGVESREEARGVIMDRLPEIEGVKVTQVHVGKYVISSLAAGLEEIL